MTPGLAGTAGTPKRRVSCVLIFNSYNLEELEAAIRWPCASASRTLHALPRSPEAQRPPVTFLHAPSRACRLSGEHSRWRGDLYGHDPAAPAGEAGGGSEAVASCATAGFQEAQTRAVAGWERRGDRIAHVGLGGRGQCARVDHGSEPGAAQREGGPRPLPPLSPVCGLEFAALPSPCQSEAHARDLEIFPSQPPQGRSWGEFC